MVQLSSDSIRLDAALCEGSARLCYVLVPGGLCDDACKWAQEASASNACSIVVVSGMDWNRDMTPWPAKGVMKKEKPFAGGAPGFLSRLENELIPGLEKELGINPSERYLMGISLSGLFAVWSIFGTGLFDGVGSVSGSLWYDGFSEWVDGQSPLSGTRVVMTLGEREKNASDKRLASVQDRTGDVLRALASKGVPAELEMVEGTHFSPFQPRFDLVLSRLLAGE